MSDKFPAQVTHKDKKGNVVETTGVVAQVDLKGLAEKLAPRLADPDTEFTSSAVVPRPGPATPTAGPHRYTIYVPHDDGARINIGAPHPDQPETGISGHTKTHISFGAYDGPHATYLTLGAKATTVGATTNLETTGYALNTAGASNHIALKEVTLSSTEAGMNINAKSEMKIGSKEGGVTVSALGSISAAAGGNVNIQAGDPDAPGVSAGFWTTVGAIGLGALDVASFAAPAAGHHSATAGGGASAGTGIANFLTGYATGDSAKLRDQFLAKYSKKIDQVLAHAATTIGLVLSFKKSWKQPKHGTATWEAGFKWVSFAVSVGTEINALIADFGGDSKTPDGGNVLINAEKNVAIAAKASASLSGTKGVKISGFKGVSISGLTSSMKGHKDASVWGGLGASLKSLGGDVAMTSDLKGASVSAKKDVKIASETGKVAVTGDVDVQLNSVTAKAFVHGKAGVYVGCDKDFGMVIAPAKLEIGSTTGADPFGGAKGDGGKTLATFDKNVVRLQSGKDSNLVVSPKAISFNTKTVNMKSTGNITLKGAKINLN